MLKFVPKGPINNIPAMVQIMAWRRPGDKPLSEPMMVSLPTHICVSRPQWVNFQCFLSFLKNQHTKQFITVSPVWLIWHQGNEWKVANLCIEYTQTTRLKWFPSGWTYGGGGGILPKGPYLPCISMAGRALLAGYPQITVLIYWLNIHPIKYCTKIW